MFEVLLTLRCLSGVFFGRTFQERYRGNAKAGQWISPRPQWLTLFGGNDGFVLALLSAQTRDLSRDHGIGRSDVVCPGTESDEGVPPPRSNTDPICCGSAGPIRRAAIFVGERARHEQDDGGYDDQADRRCRPRFCGDDGAASSGCDRYGKGRTQI